MTYKIEIKLTGDVTAKQVSSRDIGKLIAALEEMLASIVSRDNPALGIAESEVVVGLAQIKSGSYILEFETPFETEVSLALQSVAKAINNSQYDALPIKSVDGIKEARNITRKYKTEVEFWERNGQYRQLATVNTTTKIEFKPQTVEGKTTIYGTVIRVGGEEPPRVKLRLIDGTYLNCNITRSEKLRVARQLGSKLYSMVGVYGKAEWDVRDMSLHNFLVERVTDYTSTSLEDAVSSLQELVGEYYAQIDDIDQFILEMRGGDED